MASIVLFYVIKTLFPICNVMTIPINKYLSLAIVLKLFGVIS